MEEFGPTLRLFSANGYNLTIRQDGQIVGLDQDDDPDTRLQISSGGDVCLTRIQSIEHSFYVCFDSEGNLYGESDACNEATLFEERLLGSYTVYKSVKYPDWYIGIKKNGVTKNGARTMPTQKAVKFLPRRF